jgi:hypothetical protein
MHREARLRIGKSFIERKARSYGPWLLPILLTGVLAALDRARALGAGLAALVDHRASNIGDPWPTVVAARALLDRPHAPLYASFSLEGSSFIYPPVAALLMLPFARMSYEEAHLALSVVTRAAYLACVAIAFVVGRGAGTARAGVCAAVFAVAFHPLLLAVELNQATLLVAIGLGGAVLCAGRGRHALAGALIGATAALKPQMGLVVLLLVWHSRRLVWAGLASMAVAALISIGCAGVADHVDYVTRVLPRLAAGYAFYPNQSWTGAILRLAGEPFVDFELTSPSSVTKVVAVASSAATLVAAALVLRAAARRHGARAPELMVCAIGFAWLMVTLASPISWKHHFTPCMFLYSFFVATYESWTRWARALALAAFPWIAGYVEVLSWTGPIGRLASSYTLGGTILLTTAFALVLLEGFTRERAAAERSGIPGAALNHGVPRDGRDDLRRRAHRTRDGSGDLGLARPPHPPRDVDLDDAKPERVCAQQHLDDVAHAPVGER